MDGGRMDQALLTDAQVFPQGYVYGPGAPESGSAPTAAQQDYARAAATSTDHGAAVGTPQNPSYDTPTVVGDSTIYHVGPDGRMFDPVATAQAATPQSHALLSDADVFGSGGAPFTPGQTFDTRPTSQSLGALEGARTVLKNFGDLMSMRPFGASGLPLLPSNLPGNLASIGAKLAQIPLISMEKTSRPGELGKVAAETALTAPLALAGDGAPLLTGGLIGDLTSEANDPMSRLRDIGAGMAGSKLGDIAGGVGKAIISPTVRPAAQWALDNGIRLTPGGIAGGVAKSLEEGASKGTIAGPMVGTAQRQAIGDFNLATIQKNALDPAGLTLPAAAQPGTDAVNAASGLLSGAYDSLTPNLVLGKDTDLLDAAGAAKNAATTLPGAYRTRLNAFADQLLSDPTTPLTGEDVQNLTSTLRQESADAGRSGDFFTAPYGRAIDDLSGAVGDALERSNPAYADQLRGLNQGYASLVRIQRASNGALQDDGVFTPKGLLAAVKASDQSARDNATARGQALLQDWANNGKAVLPDKLPTTGSIWSHLPELAVTLGVGHEAGVPGIAAMLAGEGLGAAAYSPVAQGVIRAGMTQRPTAMKAVGDVLGKIKPLVASGSAATAVNLLPELQRRFVQP